MGSISNPLWWSTEPLRSYDLLTALYVKAVALTGVALYTILSCLGFVRVPSLVQKSHVLTFTELHLQSWLILKRMRLKRWTNQLPSGFWRFTLPEMSLKALWNKQKGHQCNVSPSKCSLCPFRMHTEQTYIHESAGEEMDREHYDRVNMDPPSLILIKYFQKDSHLHCYYLKTLTNPNKLVYKYSDCERQMWLTGRHSVGHLQTAPTQWQLWLRDVGCSTVTARNCHLDEKLK